MEKKETRLLKEERTDSQEAKLEYLAKVSRALQELLDPREAFETILDLIGGVINYRYATLFGYHARENELIPIAYRRQVVDLIPSIKFGLGSGLSAWVAQRRKPILLGSIHTSPHLSHRVVKSFISVPFMDGEDLLGVINLGQSVPGAFSFDDLETAIKMSEELSPLLIRYLLLNDLYALDTRYQKLREKLTRTRNQMARRETETVNQLARAVSHHVNNPLTSIIGNAQLLMADMEGVGSALKESAEDY
jgi:GAF domain-containing protein